MLHVCSFTLFVSSFVSIGTEKQHWGSGQLRCLFTKLLTRLALDQRGLDFEP